MFKLGQKGQKGQKGQIGQNKAKNTKYAVV